MKMRSAIHYEIEDRSSRETKREEDFGVCLLKVDSYLDEGGEKGAFSSHLRKVLSASVSGA